MVGVIVVGVAAAAATTTITSASCKSGLVTIGTGGFASDAGWVTHC